MAHRVEGGLSRRSLWVAQGASLVGLLGWVLVVRALATFPGVVPRLGTLEAGIVLAVVPTLLWLLLFYVQDAREPEPLGYVLRAAGAGAVLGAAFALPLGRALAPAAAFPSTGVVLGGLLLAAAVQEFAKFLAVRYTVFESSEFDEVADGVTYGTAAGLGLAAVLNVHLVVAGAGVDPVPATLRIVVTALAHATFGGVLGYFLGRAKLQGRWREVAWGYGAAVVLNALFAYLLAEVTRSGLAYRPWYGFVLAAAVAVAVTALLLWRVRSLGPSTAAGTTAGAGQPSWSRLDLRLWVALLVLLALGLAPVRAAVGAVTIFAHPDGLRLTYPAGWLAARRDGAALAVQAPVSRGPVPTELRVTAAPRPRGQSPAAIAAADAVARSGAFPLYRALAIEPASVPGAEAVAVEYAFVTDPHAAVLAAERIPAVVRGVELVVVTSTRVFRVDLRTSAGGFEQVRPTFDRIRRSVRVEERS
jgi:RsiW-degrading membrane proteinase PrsW (M82 family)